MHRILAIITIIAPIVAPATYAQEFVGLDTGVSTTSPFQFNPNELDSIRFSRVVSATSGAPRVADRQTAFSFKLKPNRLDFSHQGGYGLNLFGMPEVEVQSGILGPNRLQESIPDLHSGFAYSAGVKIEHEDADINGTAYVSSSLLGLSYGRLGRVWYGGIDVNLEQFSDDVTGKDQSDRLSLDVTTGRRLGWTGLSSDSPLWLLSLEGNFDVQELDGDQPEASGDWFLNPSLFWQHPGFTFSAQVQLPMESTLSATDTSVPDYRLRAVFKKQF